MAAQLRAEQTLATPTPLMQVRIDIPRQQSYASRGVGSREARRARQRRNVLRHVEAGLRTLRRDVDEQQRRGLSSLYQHGEGGASGQTRPDIVNEYSARSAGTQTELLNVAEQSLTDVTDSEGDDGGDIMEDSMEQWVEAQRPSDNVLAAHLTVLDGLFRDSLGSEPWGRPARKGRSKSLPPTWE